MVTIDRQRVQSSFHKGADAYDGHTPVQQRVLQNLLQQAVRHLNLPAQRVLDIGCGTGRLLELISQVSSDAVLSGLDLAQNMLDRAAERLPATVRLTQGDAEQLPFAAESFSLVLSSSTFQWLGCLDRCFGEVHRVLEPDGRFLFALFGGETLFELRESWQQALVSCGRELPAVEDGTHQFYREDQVLHALVLAGFKDCTVRTEREVVWYPDVPHLLQAIKKIGAGTSRPPAGGGLGWRKVVHAMADLYRDRFAVESGVPVSYDVIYAAGRR